MRRRLRSLQPRTEWARAAVVILLIAAVALAIAGLLEQPQVKTVTVTVARAEPETLVPTTPTGVKAELSRKGAVSCGTERAAVKHLTDGFLLPLVAKSMTIDQLVAMQAPAVTASSPRLPVEQQLVELENVHVVAAKQEADSDLHVILITPTGAEMNVEAPMAVCDSGPYGAELAQARAAMDAAMPDVSSSQYTQEDLTADISGVLFFDVLHGQRGAPNGVELHPVTYFSEVSP